MAVATIVLLAGLLGQPPGSGAGAPPDADSASLRQAAFERAQQNAAEGRWSEAADILTPLIEPERASADALAFLTRAVFESGDLRRARLLSERGLLRFPKDLRFRRLDLAVLVARRSWSEAAAAAKSLLAQDFADPIAWRQLAAASLALPEESERRVVLEAAHLAAPDDPAIFERHLRAQLLADHLAEAERLTERALSYPKLKTNPQFVLLAVRAAEAAKNPKLARKWLNQVAPEARDTTLSLLEARIALSEDDPQAAEAALARLIARGTTAPTILIRAGDLAEKRGDFGRAESLYAQAAEGETDAARIARLTLARLLNKIGNARRAQILLRAYLKDHPDDTYARQLLRVTERAAP